MHGQDVTFQVASAVGGIVALRVVAPVNLSSVSSSHHNLRDIRGQA